MHIHEGWSKTFCWTLKSINILVSYIFTSLITLLSHHRNVISCVRCHNNWYISQCSWKHLITINVLCLLLLDFLGLFINFKSHFARIVIHNESFFIYIRVNAETLTLLSMWVNRYTARPFAFSNIDNSKGFGLGSGNLGGNLTFFQSIYTRATFTLPFPTFNMTSFFFHMISDNIEFLLQDFSKFRRMMSG